MSGTTVAGLLREPAAGAPARALVPPRLLAASRSRPAAATARTTALYGGYVLVGLLTGVVTAGVGLLAGAAASLALLVALLLAAVAWRTPYVAVVAVALALPLGQLTVGPAELVQVSTAAVVLAVLVPAAARGQVRLPPWPVAVPLAAFLVVAALSTPRAWDADLAFRLDVQLLLLVLLTVAVTTAVRTPAQAYAVATALVVGGGAAAVPALLDSGPTESYYGGGVVTGRALGIFAQPNELGIFAAVLLVVAVGLGLTASRRAARVTCAVGGSLLLAALVVSLSRGAWAGAVAGLVALAVLVPRTRRALAVLGAVLVVAAVVLGALGVGPVAEVGVRVASLAESTENPYDQRPLIWAEALRLVAESPLLGHGPGGFTAAAGSDALRTGAFLDVDHAHDLVLNVAVEHGLVGLLALLALVAGLASLLRRRHAPGPGPDPELLPRVLAAALVVVLAHGIVDYPLRNPTTMTTVWLVLSLLAAAAVVTARRARPEQDA
ncbi:O-antigen ligase family protein [Nocardioides sp. NPDC092400]|uniref:O-antigen ligase family protein n=1 Tax=Nocardioides sp. NPDC092400 TaxID=3155196 RepID=UPI00343E4D23